MSCLSTTCTPDWQATPADRLVIVLHRSSTSPSPTCHHRQNLPTQTTAPARKAPGNWTRTSLTNTQCATPSLCLIGAVLLSSLPPIV
ncbi:hypothetical protein CMEL01_01494 [Colletotrichum melonis]|uniref:Uncharacterized protein n=1 Tax=Colletotrichum melonis TaxID=1209925 RepID=A0AAI9V389_9PEZI|nr:hypothetical protein CMEL01_01494 [Colletotrichum melonis]